MTNIKPGDHIRVVARPGIEHLAGATGKVIKKRPRDHVLDAVHVRLTGFPRTMYLLPDDVEVTNP